mmetsp:Transcript_17513/g.26589  ORF Transcript_17513/g.26589 Transcript_17513/m.26589 type:complete len:1030 (+) Transcript_17513:213-3302(+)
MKQSSASSTTRTTTSMLSCDSRNGSFEGLEYKSTPVIVGRNDELLALTSAYDRVKKNRSFEMVTVHGESGCGKTSLVMKLQESIILENGFFCFGKCFQNSEVMKQDPYSAIMTAFSDLCDLMLQSDNFDEERRRKIEKELGYDGMLLINAVSNISPFLGDKMKLESYRGVTYRSCSFARFKVACKRFVQAMSAESPIVLFIDDIQWMDNGSTELLEFLSEDAQMQNFMLILTYRDEDESSVKKKISTLSAATVDVQVDNLDLNSVQEMLANRIGSEVENNIGLEALAKLLSHKANGNPFYIANILETMKEDGLLYLDKNSSWICDLDIIQEKFMISDSFADLITNKIQRLDDYMKELLKMASLLGYRFTHQVIYGLVDEVLGGGRVEERGKEDDASLTSMLQDAIGAKIIEETYDGYQFTHDKLQAAFYTMLDATEKEKLHLKIGKHLLRKKEISFKYLAATHLNQCAISSLGSQAADYVLLARTYLEASKYCDSRNAFLDAVMFLRKGLSFLGEGEEKWSTNYDLTLEMTEFLAKLEFTLGNIDACTCANQEAMKWAVSKKTRVNALSLEIDIQITNNDISNVGRAGKNALHELGVNLPAILTPFHLLRKLRRVRTLLDSMDDSSIYNLRTVDPDLPDVCKLIHFIGFYFASSDKVFWVIYTTLLGTEYTLQNGLSQHSAALLNLYGVCEKCIMRNKTRAYRLGRLALELSFRLPRQHAARVASTVHIIFDEQVIRTDRLHFTPTNLNDGLVEGDFSLMVVFGNISFFLRFWTGEHIESLESSIRAVHERLIELDQTGLLMHFQPLLQLLLHLRNEEEENLEELLVLTGDMMNETEFRNFVLASRPPDTVEMGFLFSKMVLAYYLGFNKVAETYFLKMQKMCPPIFIESYLLLTSNMFNAMISCARYRETGRRKYLYRARKCRKCLQHRHSLGNPNANPFLRVVEAEETLLKPHNSSQICELYDFAIDVANKQGIVYLEAISCERAFRLLLDFKCVEDSQRYLEMAKHSYREKWGSLMKHKWLCQKYD